MSVSWVLGGASPSSVVGAGGGGGGGGIGGDVVANKLTVLRTAEVLASPPAGPTSSAFVIVEPANPAVPAQSASRYIFEVGNATGDEAGPDFVEEGALQLVGQTDGDANSNTVYLRAGGKPTSTDGTGANCVLFGGTDQVGQIWLNNTGANTQWGATGFNVASPGPNTACILNPRITAFSKILLTPTQVAGSVDTINDAVVPVVVLCPGTGFTIYAYNGGQPINRDLPYTWMVLRY
jgi:hypothetical protein